MAQAATAATALIIKTGDSIQAAHRAYGDFDEWFIRYLDDLGVRWTVINVHQGEALPSDTQGVLCAIITGSAAMVSHRHAWAEQTAGWLRQAHQAGLPMLGVCFGHQLLAHAFGGEVGPNPSGRRMGSYRVEVITDGDPLLGPCAPSACFQATHLERVLRLPQGATVLATVDGDPHHALHFGGRCWGVQFHPEFDEAIMARYVEARAQVLRGEGFFPEQLLDSLAPTPAGPALLRRFVQLAFTHSHTLAPDHV